MSKQKNETIETVGIDLGAGAVKIWTARGGLQFPAQVAVKVRDLIDQSLFGLELNTPKAIEFAGSSFFVGTEAHDYGMPLEDWDHDRFDSAPVRALVYTALTLVGAQTSAPLRVVLGLPQGIAMGSGAAERMEAARRWVSDDGGEHKWLANGQRQRARIAETLATSQPRGAMVDAITDELGVVTRAGRTLHEGRVGVISIGFNTLELLALDQGRPMAVLASGELLGVRRLLETMNTARRRTAGQMDADLRSGRVNLNGHLSQYGRQVLAQVADVWGERWRDWQGIVAVGGGVHLLQRELESTFGALLVPISDPVLSTARGLYKLGLQTARKAEREATHAAPAK